MHEGVIGSCDHQMGAFQLGKGKGKGGGERVWRAVDGHFY